jgi:hypothetical protein
MKFVKPVEAAEPEKTAEAEVEGNIRELVRRDSLSLRNQPETDGEMIANNVGSLVRRVSGTSTREIDNLIRELQTLRERLASDGTRVQREIVEYAALSQSVMQLTKIISDSLTHVKKLPDAPSISG